jgi:hypothetical protein
MAILVVCPGNGSACEPIIALKKVAHYADVGF